MDDIQAIIHNVKLLETAGRASDAVEILTLRIGYGGDSPASIFHKAGQLSRQLGRYQEAKKVLQQGLTAYPCERNLHLELAFVFRDMLATEECIKEWIQVQAIDPDMAEANFTLGFLYAADGWLDRAVAQFEGLGACSDGFWLAEIRSAKARKEQAELFIDAAEPLLKRDDNLIGRLVDACISVGRLEAAEQHLQKLQDHSNSVLLDFRLKWRLNGLEAATSFLEEHIRYDRKNREMFLVLVDSYIKLNQIEKALNRCNVSLFNIYQEEPEFILKLACISNSREVLQHINIKDDLDRMQSFKSFQYILTIMISSNDIISITGISRAKQMPDIIPRRIFQFWDLNPIPADVAQVIKTWSLLENRGVEITIFNDEAAREFLVEHYPTVYLEAYQRCFHPAMKSDFIRLCFLYLNGGVYIDVDEENVGGEVDICSALQHASFCAPLSIDNPKYVNNNLIASTPGHPVLQIALESLVPRLLEEKHGDIWSISGPGLLTRSIIKHRLSSSFDPADIALLSVEYLRSICRPRYDLEYKNFSWGNWRLFKGESSEEV